MNLKKLVLIVTCFMVLVSCGSCRKMKKIVKVKFVGDIAYLDGLYGSNFIIEDLDIKSNGNLFYLGDYICHENGKTYNVLDSDNNIVSTIKLIEKDKIYEKKKLYIKLDEYEFKVLNVPLDVGEIHIIGEKDIEKELSINVEYRTSPLDIYLENANIYTKERVPVIYNYSRIDINIYVEGDNSVKAGCEYPSISDVELVRNEKINDDIEVAYYSPWIMYWITMEGTISNILSIGSGEFAQEFKDNMEREYELTKIWWDSLYNILIGYDGIDGLNGVPAIHSISGVSLRGTGNINIYGGNGADGGDASNLAVTGAKGGDGGDSGPALYVYSYINVMEGNYTILCGDVGLGGEGTKFIGHYDGDDGNKGEKTNNIKAVYLYEKK